MATCYDTLWWIAACGGESYVTSKVGLPPVICEAIYLKYMDGVANMSRVTLFIVLSFLKRYLGMVFSKIKIYYHP